jgi:hemerythrin-like metal-binding protein
MFKGVAWDEMLVLGVPALDDQHRAILAVLAQIEDLAAARADAARIGVALDRLKGMLVEHFRHEEALLADPRLMDGEARLVQHRAAHRRLLDDLDLLMVDLRRRPAGASPVVAAGFGRLLLEEIIRHDATLVLAQAQAGVIGPGSR